MNRIKTLSAVKNGVTIFHPFDHARTIVAQPVDRWPAECEDTRLILGDGTIHSAPRGVLKSGLSLRFQVVGLLKGRELNS